MAPSLRALGDLNLSSRTSARTICEVAAEAAALLIVAAESLEDGDIPLFRRWLADQPEWSDLPVILLEAAAPAGSAPDQIGMDDVFGNLIVVGRPFRPATLSRAVRAALRDRARQHEVRRLLQKVEESEALFASTFENESVGVAHVGSDARWMRVNQTLCGLLGREIQDLVGREVGEIIQPDYRQALDRALAEIGSGEVRTRSVEVRCVRQDGSLAWLEMGIAPARAIHRGAGYMVWIINGISARKRAEEDRRTLLRELAHRVKNTLAVIQSMAKQTARTTQTKQEFLVAFEGRITSLANTHNLLTDTNWNGVDLRDLVETQLQSVLDEAARRVSIDGPSVYLMPASATAIAMVFHEMATNARKYGALSVPQGGLGIVWETVVRPDGRHVMITWREHGGPRVRVPTREGFGTRLMRASGKSEFRYPPGGFEAYMDFALPPDAAPVDADGSPGPPP